MNFYARTTIATLSFLIFSTGAVLAEKVATEGAELGKWTQDYEAALKLAKEKDRPILINFTGSDWCGWCKLMDANVFAQAAWKNYAAEHVVLVTIDFPNDKSIVPAEYVERNAGLQKKFGVRGYPTYIILDSNGETPLGKLGAGQKKTPESFIKEFKSTVRLSKGNIAKYMAAHPDDSAFKDAIKSYRDVEKELDAWIATRPEKNEENMKKLEQFRKRIETAESNLDKFDF